MFAAFLLNLAVLSAPPTSAATNDRPWQPSMHPAGPPRPRLLLNPADVARTRNRCGTAVGDPSQRDMAFGSHLREFRHLRDYVSQNLPLAGEPGGLYPAAFLHLAAGRPGIPDEYTRYLDRELMARETMVLDFDDVAAALDWCWSALEPVTRATVVTRLLDHLEPLKDTDNPFEHFLFNPKLCHVAAALALEGTAASKTPQDDRIQAILTAARRYFAHTLPPLMTQLRGTAPVPAIRADFEADMILAAELWRSMDDRAWSALRDPMSDALDVYLWSDTGWPALASGILHDAGTSSPIAPGSGTGALAPGTADVLADRTGSAVAAFYAARAAQDDSTGTLRDAQRRWLHILHGGAAGQVQRELAPRARCLGNGWVLMRDGWREGGTLVAFDAGQPVWVDRQHRDAGQFQIIRKGRLAIDSGDDVGVEAILPRGGSQHVGGESGDFDLYSASTVAHNCVVLTNPRARQTRIGSQWIMLANQRDVTLPRGKPVVDVKPEERATGRLIAFETNDYFSFACADLARAYGVDTALVYERSLLLIDDGLLLIADRLETAAPTVAKSWVLHLPSTPTIDGAPLDPHVRRRAEGSSAGSWVYPSSDAWLSTTADGGRLFVRTLMPTGGRWHLLGGPAEMLTVPRGPAKGRPYVGGSARSFEYWLSPDSINGGANAWYRLGNPATLGPAFGAGSGWGRLEVEDPSGGTRALFVHALVATDRDKTTPPTLDVTRSEDGVMVRTTLSGRDYAIELTPRGSPRGRIEIRDPQRDKPLHFTLTNQVTPAKPLQTN